MVGRQASSGVTYVPKWGAPLAVETIVRELVGRKWSGVQNLVIKLKKEQG